MIQDITPHFINNAYQSDQICQPTDPVFVFRLDRLLLLAEHSSLRLPTKQELPQAKDITYLFSYDHRSYYLARSFSRTDDHSTTAMSEDMIYARSADEDDPKEVTFGARTFLSLRMSDIRRDPRVRKDQYFSATIAFHLYRWYEESHFCGHCATPLVHDDRERAMVCPSCKARYYPRIMPAVIVGVIDKENDKLLITRYANRPISYDALVAGFTEIGETLEDNVRREVKEETGLDVTNIRYYKSQPWGVVSDLLMGFYCDVEGSREITLDGELKKAIWLSRDEIAGQPDDLSLTNEMMITFRDGKEPK